MTTWISTYVKAAVLIPLILLATPSAATAKPPLVSIEPTTSAREDQTRTSMEKSREESLPFGIDLLICVAGAKLGGATLSQAVGQCSGAARLGD